MVAASEKKVNWIKVRAILSLIIPIPLIIFIAVPRLEFSTGAKFIIGILLFGLPSVIGYYWAIRYFLLVEKVDFSKPMTSVRKHLIEVEKFKTKITKLGYILSPFVITGIFLSGNIPFFSVKMIPFHLLVLLIFASSVFIAFKHGILKTLKRINKEIEDIMKLEGH